MSKSKHRHGGDGEWHWTYESYGLGTPGYHEEIVSPDGKLACGPHASLRWTLIGWSSVREARLALKEAGIERPMVLG